MSGVSFRSATKRFGAVVALDALDLEIADGEFVSLLGPSGSGKTTTLNLLAGLLPLDGGEIAIGGRQVGHLPPDQRDIAMVFQNYALYPHMTVAENLAFPLEARRPRPARAEIDTRITTVAETLGIAPLLARLPKELSGGQQQRVALGRAMVRDPKVFLLDEPLSNLDARLRIRMRHDLKALHQRLRGTIVYVTHDQAEALTLSDRIAVFNQGRLQQVGSPSDIYDRPANLFVAGFVGEREMAVIEGEIGTDGKAPVFHGAGLTIALGAHWTGLSPGHAVTMGLRPEAVAAAPSGCGEPATVTLTELSGPDLVLHASPLAAPAIELAARASRDCGMTVGDVASLRFDAGLLHLFESRTGLAIPR